MSRVPSGKYKGELKFVLLEDSNYCQWIMDNVSPKSALYQYLIEPILIPFCWICKNVNNEYNEKVINHEHKTCVDKMLKRRDELYSNFNWYRELNSN